jgi:outer membrane lipoprotein-sorting protein
MKYRLLLSALLLIVTNSAIAGEGSGIPPTAEEIVNRMAAHDLARQGSIEGYVGMRRYVLENHKYHKRAEMLVQVRGDQDGTKHFEIISQEGWGGAHKHVLRKMLESETETSRPEMRASAKLTTQNYEFALVGTELLGSRQAYVLEVHPRRNEKYLFQGRIWVDAEDYALARAEGKPAKKPSFWTKDIHFVQIYQKHGPLWFPLSTQSETEAHLFGTTDVKIEYRDYEPRTSNAAANSLASTEVIFKP